MSFNPFSIIRTSLIVILFGLNHLNCEPPKSHIKFISLPIPSDQLNDDDRRSTFDLLDHIDENSALQISTDHPDHPELPEHPEHRVTDRTILLPSAPITSSEDYYTQIAGWSPDFCDEDEIYVKSQQKCLKRSFIAEECISSEQCIVPQSVCARNMCVCVDYFVDYSRNKCIPIHNTAIEIYKITMIFASSCLALILLIFLACILRKSYCPADSSHQGANRSTINDLFTIYPGTSGSPSELFSTLTPMEKPPSYNETMRMINQEIGTPPPAYHNIFYTETSSSSSISAQSTSTHHPTNNSVNSNDPSSTSSRPSQSDNCNNGSVPATSSPHSTTINAQNHNQYSSTRQPSPAIVPPPSAPLIAVFNQGKVNTAFDCDS